MTQVFNKLEKGRDTHIRNTLYLDPSKPKRNKFKERTGVETDILSNESFHFDMFFHMSLYTEGGYRENGLLGQNNKKPNKREGI